MKLLAVSIVALGLAVVYGTHAADTGSRPPGVDAGNWYRISDRLGFVAAPSNSFGIVSGDRQVLLAAPENLGADLLPPLKGYFVMQTPSGWRSIVLSDPAPIAR